MNGAAAGAEDSTRLRASTGAPAAGKISPELLAWARQQFNEEEFIAGLREVQEKGGLELHDFIDELERELEPRE